MFRFRMFFFWWMECFGEKIVTFSKQLLLNTIVVWCGGYLYLLLQFYHGIPILWPQNGWIQKVKSVHSASCMFIMYAKLSMKEKTIHASATRSHSRPTICRLPVACFILLCFVSVLLFFSSSLRSVAKLKWTFLLAMCLRHSNKMAFCIFRVLATL